MTEDIDEKASKYTRKDFQIPRRMFHMGMGITCGLVYQLLLTHQRAIYILGTSLCILYIFEQLRINYPEHAGVFSKISKYFLRAEEQLKESASIPFVMGILLTILSFPKIITLVAIYTLAIGDPLSALIGIRFGKKKISENKTLEGSLAFFGSAFVVILIVFCGFYDYELSRIFILALLSSTIIALFELVPIRLDDNLTIPLFTAITVWFMCALLGIQTLT